MQKNNQKQPIDRSLGTQLNSKKLHTVKETCLITGLTRKQLFDYLHLVEPTALDKSGYKLYDDCAVEKLKQIARLRKIRMPLKLIQDVLEKRMDEKSAILKQIDCLLVEKEEIAKCILKANEMIG